MCKFFSAIVTKNDVLWDSRIDSHTELLEKFKIKDDTDKPDFVRVEIVPPDYSAKSFKDLSNWKFKVDQDLLPKWFNKKDVEDRTILALKQFISKCVVFEGNHVFKNERVFCFGSSRAVLLESSSAVLWELSSAELYGSSRAVLRESSSAVLRESSRAVLRESSSAVLWGSSSAVLWGSSRAVLLESSSAELYGSSSAELYGSSSAVLWELSSAELWGSSRAKLNDHSVAVNRARKEIFIPKDYKVKR